MNGSPDAVTITGDLRRIFFYRDGFGILSLRVGNDTVSVKGKCAEPRVGMMFECEGQWKTDTTYGPYFAATRIREQLPTDGATIEKYLASAKIPGVGKTTAKKLVDAFGADVFTVLTREPDRLAGVPRLPRKTREKIVVGWQKARITHEVDLFLTSIGIAPGTAAKVVRAFGGENPNYAAIIERIRANPYDLVDIPGIGFKTADAAALRMGIEADSRFRIAAGLVYALQELATSGHTLTTNERLVEKAVALLSVDEKAVALELDAQLYQEKSPVIATTYKGQACVALRMLHSAETGIARELQRLSQASHGIFKRNDVSLDAQIQADDGSGITLTAIQREAVRLALTEKVSILTGGPGMGKTTITRKIVELARAAGKEVSLCAPTGRAAKRLSEATGRPASTIHLLLGFRDGAFYHNRDNPLGCDLLVMDETSMTDVYLMYAVLRALPEEANVLFVGDTDQLPSVGAGNVLSDMISSDCIKYVRLTKVHRQGEGSGIVVGANDIINGRAPKYCDEFKILTRKGNGSELSREAANDEEAAQWVIAYAKQLVAKGARPHDIQVIAPMRRGFLGVEHLNTLLQDLFNPASSYKPQIEYRQRIYRVGDRVMQTRNNYDLGVMNGDMGVIKTIDVAENEIVISFSGEDVEMKKGDLDDVDVAYAITIHKSQGGEFPIVLMTLSTSHYVMLNRNLVYTAVTRARERVAIAGFAKAMHMAVGTKMQMDRMTALDEYLQRQLPMLAQAA